LKHIAKKRFGQHFLVDPAVIENIVSAIAPQRGQAVVEIGPGLSAITRPLSEALGQLCVIELDRDLAQGLRHNPRLKVIERDVLQVDFTALQGEWQPTVSSSAEPVSLGVGGERDAPMPKSRLRVVGNLPYNISTPILFHLLEHVNCIEDQHFMLQLEVVERMVAPVGDSDYSRLSVMLQWRYEMECVLRVGEDAFDPPPKVKSAVVRMTPLRDPPRLEVDRFSSMVQAAFSQRRKLLRHTLEPWLMEQGWGGEFDFKRRAQEVSVQEYVALAQSLPVRSS
jgi:16S rRNA (adenine1518-N6/adenine1519-N6)-dimethyltransferase